MPEIILTLDSSGAVTGLKQYENEAKKAGQETDKLNKKTKESESAFSKMSSFVRSASGALTAFTALAGSAFVVMSAGLVKLAADSEATERKFAVVFQGMEEQANLWAESIAGNYGLTEQATKKYMASVQDLLVPMGLQREAAGEMSNTLVQLASDLAIWENVPMEQTVQDITSALTGSYEVMKKYGVVINETAIKEQALSMGIAETTKNLSPAQKAMAAYQLILQGTADAQGATADSSGDIDFQLRKMNTTVTELKTSIGEWLLPTANELITKFNEWSEQNNNLEQTLYYLTFGVQGVVSGMAALYTGTTVIIAVFAQLLNSVMSVTWPLETLINGLMKLGLIDTNPLTELKNGIKEFGEMANQAMVDAANGTKALNDQFSEQRKRLKEIIDGAEKTKPALENLYPKATIDSQTFNETQENIAGSINQVGTTAETTSKKVLDLAKAEQILQMSAEEVALTTAEIDELYNKYGVAVYSLTDKEYRLAQAHGTVAEYMASLINTTSQNSEQVKNADYQTQKLTEKVQASTEAFLQQADAVNCASNSIAGYSNQAGGVPGGKKDEEEESGIKFGATFTSSGDLVKDFAALLAAAKERFEIVRPADKEPYISIGGIMGRADPNYRNRSQAWGETEQRYYREFVNQGGNPMDWQKVTNYNNTTNVYVTEKVSRSDIENIITEIQRTEARA